MSLDGLGEVRDRDVREDAALRRLADATARSEAARHVGAADALLGAAETRDRALVRELVARASGGEEGFASAVPRELLRRAAATIDRLLAVQAKLAGGA